MRRAPPLLVACLLLGTTAASAQNAPAAPAPSAPTAAAADPSADPSSAADPSGTGLAVGSSFTLDSLPDETALASLLWERAPEFAQARARVASAVSDVTRAALLPNPQLDLSWNTIPLGPTNPPGLNPLRDVPNYQAGLSQLVEIGKRGPRQQSVRAALSAAALDVQADLRERTYDVLERAAAVATAQVRLGELEQLVTDAAKLTDLQRIRQQRGDTAGLDVDRAVLEEAQLQGQLAEEHSNLAEAILECSRVVGLACTPFSSREAASAFLAARLSRSAPIADVAQRPDLRSLESQRQSARAALTLARRGWVPDPTVHAGYVHDRFTESGNQRDSVSVGVTIPLPVFDRGQANIYASSALAEAAERTRLQLTAQAARDERSFTVQREALETRRNRVRQQNLPLASALVNRLDAAVKAGGASLQDLIFARRTYGQLLLDAADLDLSAFKLSVALDRVRAVGPAAPADLSERF